MKTFTIDEQNDLLLASDDDQVNIDLLRIKTGEAEIEIRLIELLQLESEEFLIPSCPGYGTVHQEAESFHLRFGPLVAEDYGDFGRVAAGPCPQLARGFKSQMAVHHFAVAAHQHGDLESELPDADAHAIDRGVVLAWISRIEDQLLDRPSLDFSGWQCNHAAH
jgi:hypothetical protein